MAAEIRSGGNLKTSGRKETPAYAVGNLKKAAAFFAGEMNTDFELVNVDSVADFTDASIRLSASSTPTYFMPGCWMPRNLLGR